MKLLSLTTIISTAAVLTNVLASPTPELVRRACSTTYTSVAGDNCNSIGAKFGLAGWHISNANSFLNCDDICTYTMDTWYWPLLTLEFSYRGQHANLHPGLQCTLHFYFWCYLRQYWCLVWEGRHYHLVCQPVLGLQQYLCVYFTSFSSSTYDLFQGRVPPFASLELQSGSL
jgi:hypothetical protein